MIVWVMAVAPITNKIDLIIAAVEGRNPFNQFLASFDPDTRDGAIILTDDIRAAKHYERFEEVLAEWQTQSTAVPLRDDGKPNRPLTAYSVYPLQFEIATN